MALHQKEIKLRFTNDFNILLTVSIYIIDNDISTFLLYKIQNSIISETLWIQPICLFEEISCILHVQYFNLSTTDNEICNLQT